ncbi:MAG TPA: hypothetical protein DEQ47_18400 [Solibacterales bacterium]|nr:hypothetical protein [Bryobacterales bacterium]
MPNGGPVYLSGDRHEIIVSLDEAGKPAKIVRVPLWNNIAPKLAESLEHSTEGMIRYTFRLSNGARAKDNIGTWALLIPAAPIPVQSLTGPPPPSKAWRGASSGTTVTVDQAALGHTEKGRYLRWFPQNESGVIAPGETLDGFGVESSLLPGFTTAWFASGKLVEFDQSWPEAIFRKLEKFEDKKWREVYLASIGPMFTAADSTWLIAQNYLAGVQDWIESGRLRAASPFVSQSISALNQLSESKTGDRNIQARPSTGDEKLIARAMQLSLGVHSGPE